jgi:hypothetical protein
MVATSQPSSRYRSARTARPSPVTGVSSAYRNIALAPASRAVAYINTVRPGLT